MSGRGRFPRASGVLRRRLPSNALVQLQARYHHRGEAASEKCLSAATFVRWRLPVVVHTPIAIVESTSRCPPRPSRTRNRRLKPTNSPTIARLGLPLLSGSPPMNSPTIAPNKAQGTPVMIPTRSAAVPCWTHTESTFATAIERTPNSVPRSTLSPSTLTRRPSTRPDSRLARRTDGGLPAPIRSIALRKLESASGAGGSALDRGLAPTHRGPEQRGLSEVVCGTLWFSSYGKCVRPPNANWVDYLDCKKTHYPISILRGSMQVGKDCVVNGCARSFLEQGKLQRTLAQVSVRDPGVSVIENIGPMSLAPRVLVDHARSVEARIAPSSAPRGRV